MPLFNEEQHKEVVLKAGLLLVGIALNALEFFIPRVPLFPWLKPGLANIVTLIWIIRYGLVESLLYALLRIWIVSFYFGFSFFTFALGFSGAVCACTAMALSWQFMGRYRILGTVGMAVIGALFHNMGQLFAVYLLMAQNSRLFYQIPIMLIASVIFGGIVGMMVPILLRVIEDDTVLHQAGKVPIPGAIGRIRPLNLVISVLFLVLCVMLVFVNNIYLLLGAAVFVTLFVQGLVRGSLNAFVYPVKRFWMLFLFIGILHGFFTYGTKYTTVPFLTREGVIQTVTQWLRLWAWLETTFVFFHLKFHTVVLKGLQGVFGGHRSTLYAGILAVEYFPPVVAMVQHKARTLLGMLFRKPSRVIIELFTGILETVSSEE